MPHWEQKLFGALLAGLLGCCGCPAQQISPGDKIAKLISAAQEQTAYTLHYDGSYRRMRYPGGDVPRDRGVCTDVLIRAFRAAGVDLQQAVHEDMQESFSEYPQRWGLSRPDPNIDHRRVANLMTFFRRQKKSLSLPVQIPAVLPGDVIARGIWVAGFCM